MVRLVPEGKGISFLPNLITTGAVFCGFYSIMQSINGNYERAAWAIIAAGVFDLLDGRIARMTGSVSDFGIAYDSLSDFCSFGFAPALLAYFWLLQPHGRWGWAGAFLFVACAALRLAKYNVQAEEAEDEGGVVTRFSGLPTPGAAGLVVTGVLVHQAYVGTGRLGSLPLGLIMMIIVYGSAFLMVSTVPFRTFKDLDFRALGPFKLLVISAAVLAGASAWPELVLFGLCYSYLVAGLIEFVHNHNQRQRLRIAEKKEAKQAA